MDVVLECAGGADRGGLSELRLVLAAGKHERRRRTNRRVKRACPVLGHDNVGDREAREVLPDKGDEAVPRVLREGVEGAPEERLVARWFLGDGGRAVQQRTERLVGAPFGRTKAVQEEPRVVCKLAERHISDERRGGVDRRNPHALEGAYIGRSPP